MHERTTRLLTNVLLTALGKGGGLLSAIVAVPLLASRLDPVGFGMWAVCQTLVGWMQALDAGLGLSLQNSVSGAHDPASRERAARDWAFVAGTAIVLASSVTVVGWLLLHWAPVARWLFGAAVAGAHATLAQQLLLCTLCTMAISLLVQPYVRAMHGVERGGWASLAASAGGLLGLAVLIVSDAWGGVLLGILGLMLLPVLSQYLVAVLTLRRPAYRWLTTASHGSWREGRRLLIDGGWLFISQVSAIIVFQTDAVIISAALGPVEAGSYQITARLFSYVIMIYAIVMAALWPALARAWSERDLAWIAAIYRHAWLVSGALSALVVALAIVGPWVVERWTGLPELRPSSLLVLGLAWHCLATLVANLHATCLNACREVRFPALVAAIQSLSNLGLVLLVVRYWGANGVAWATAACATLTSVPWLWWRWHRCLRQRSPQC